MKKIVCFIGLAFLLVVMPTSANATSVTSQLFFYETNLLSDNSAEYLLNKPTGGGTEYTTDDGDTLLQMGDRLRGWFEIATVEDTTGGGGTNYFGGTTGVNELSGVFELEVTGFTDLTSGYANYVFGPSTAFETIYGTGAIVATFEDASPDYERTFGGTIPGPDDTSTTVGTSPWRAEEEKLIDTADNGTLYWVFGFTGAGGSAAPGEGWSTPYAPIDISVFATTPSGSSLGSANFALNLIPNALIPAAVGTPTGPPLGLVPSYYGGLVNANASANLLGIQGIDTPADLYDDFNIAIKPVPEPATMLLLGTGLIGLAGWARKKKFFKKN